MTFNEKVEETGQLKTIERMFPIQKVWNGCIMEPPSLGNPLGLFNWRIVTML